MTLKCSNLGAAGLARTRCSSRSVWSVVSSV